VRRPKRALRQHLVLHEGDLAAAQDEQQLRALSARVPEALQLRGEPLGAFAEVGELVQHDDEALLLRAFRGDVQGRGPVRELDAREQLVLERARECVAEAAQVVLLAHLRREEVDRAVARAELLQELGLADPAPAVEDEELGLAGIVQLFEEGQFAVATEEHGALIPARIIRSSIKRAAGRAPRGLEGPSGQRLLPLAVGLRFGSRSFPPFGVVVGTATSLPAIRASRAALT
jgi:hypothetical protein